MKEDLIDLHTPGDHQQGLVGNGSDTLRELILQGKLTEAFSHSRQCAKGESTDADVWLSLAMACDELNRIDHARQACFKALDSNPSLAIAHGLAGLLALKAGAAGAAEEAAGRFQQALALDPEEPQTLLNLGSLLLQQGRHAEAEDYLQRAVAVAPGEARAYNNLGNATHQQGRAAEARALYQTAIELIPDYGDALVNLALVHRESGELDQAMVVAGQALGAVPDSMPTRGLLAGIHELRGETGQALEILREMLSVQEDQPEIHWKVGSLLLLSGHFPEAVAAHTEAIRFKPDFAEAYHGRGLAYQASGDFHQAAVDIQRSLQISPEQAGFYISLGRLYFIAGKLVHAEESYRKAIALNPGLPRAHSGLGMLHLAAGRSSEAEACFDKALEMAPAQVEAATGKASLREKQGAFEAAYEALKPLLDQGLNETQLALTFAKVAPQLGKVESAIAVLKGVLVKPTVTAYERVELMFAVAKMYDKTDQYADAFEYCRRANTEIPLKYDAEQQSELVDRTITVFDRTTLKNQGLAGVSDAAGAVSPVFIVGIPRSGTTLTEQILATHPDVHGCGELPYIAELVQLIAGTAPYGEYLSSVPQMNQAALQQMAEGYIKRLPGKVRSSRLMTDKMPYNFLFLGLIQWIFPGARIVHCVRDARDTCLSCYFQSFLGQHEYNHDLADLGHYYAEYERLMKHWQSVLDVPMLELRYEDMVNNQEAETRRLLEFCGLDWDPACMNFHKSGRTVTTSSYDQVRRPLYSSSVGRWRNYASELGPLFEALEKHGNAGSS